MRRPRPLYFLGRALVNLRGAPLPAFVGAATIGVAVFLFGALLVTGQNLRRAVVGWAGDAEHLTVYVAREIDPSTTAALVERISSLPEIDHVRVIPPEEALGDLRRALGDDAGLLDGVEARSVLPPIVSVSLRSPRLDPDAVRSIAARLRRWKGVDSVESETLWLEQFSRLVAIGRWLLLGWGVILGTGSLLVVGNSARLAAMTRRQEIEVLRLVGASDAFVVMPFFWEGLLAGAVGSLVGVAALAAGLGTASRSLAGDPFFAPMLAHVRFLDAASLATLAACGPALGALGSVASALRYLRGVPL